MVLRADGSLIEIISLKYETMKIIKAISQYFGKYSLTRTKANRLKYLVVNTDMTTRYHGALSNYEACQTTEFSTIRDVRHYLRNSIAKDDLRWIRVFKEVKPLDTQQNNK